MKPLVLLFVLWVPLAAYGQETEVRFVTDDPSPVFRISSLVVETPGLSVTSEFNEVLKKMELLTVAPSTIRIPNGDYWLNWGGTEDFSRSFTLRATGEPVEVRLEGNRQATLWSLVAVVGGGLGALAALPFVTGHGAVPWVACGASASVAAGGMVGLVLFFPRVAIR